MVFDPTNDLTEYKNTQFISTQSLWIILSSLLLIASLFSSHIYASEIYTWVDEYGVTHFSQEPPEQQSAEKMYSEDIKPKKIGSVSPTSSPKMAKASTELERAALAIKHSDKAQAKSICESARHSLNVLTSHSKLNRKSKETGKTVAMTEEQRQATIAEQKERISLFCEK
ncbi:DUF4124 domain-containing protein [Shewanella abyssi]|uniref:DUF4124 domain-containing protein n=1 Tax=Shewanella abyssi TaxID=311789 RepID=UPI00200F7C9C|nr:DUF4124 domain-containing protein [Shewanella abyssi]MCL1051586.1 DUF4124 domain-containing protein [Shewanella abyssi]